MISAEKKSVGKQRKIPDALIYEVIDGTPIYYQGYKAVLNNSKKIEDIMGSSSLQSIIIVHLISIIVKSLKEDEFWLMTNQAGVHLDHRNNLAGDIMLYERKRLHPSDINNEYTKKPANLVIEVDTKADLSVFTFQEYMKLKTTKLHNFGVDKIIWILTASRQVVVAVPDADWLLIDWNKDIEIINGITFNIGNYLKKNGIELEGKL